MARSTSLASTFGNNSSKRPRRGVAPPTQISRSAIIFGLLNVEGAVSGDSERRALAGLPFTGASRMLRTTELAGCAFAPGASVSFADLENTRGDMPQVVAWALAPLGLHPTVLGGGGVAGERTRNPAPLAMPVPAPAFTPPGPVAAAAERCVDNTTGTSASSFVGPSGAAAAVAAAAGTPLFAGGGGGLGGFGSGAAFGGGGVAGERTRNPAPLAMPAPAPAFTPPGPVAAAAERRVGNTTGSSRSGASRVAGAQRACSQCGVFRSATMSNCTFC
jgi:hypothetical protein